MEVVIEKVGINGEGIGFINKQPIFIPGALPQEVVDVKIVQKFAKYQIGELEKVIKQSYDRAKPICKISDSCGACSFMHAKYEKQLEYKYDVLRQSLIKYAQVNPRKISKVVGSDSPTHYRNSLKLPFAMREDRLVLGMYTPNSNYFVPIQECIIHERRLEQVKNRILTILNRYDLYAFDNRHKDGLRHLVLRGFQDKFQCTIVSGITTLPEKCIDELMEIDGMTSLWQSHNPTKKSIDIIGTKLIHLEGKKKLSFRFMDFRLQVSPKSFFQLNTKQAEKLYKIVDSCIDPNQNLIVEAYSGIGVMSLMASKKAKQVIGIEFVKDAVSNATKNAMRNDKDNVKFISGDSAKELAKIAKNQVIDTLIVDPPRSGLDESMLACLLGNTIKKIIYISCNPATLAKNIKVLNEKYEVESVQPIDMFSYTAHVESVVVLKSV